MRTPRRTRSRSTLPGTLLVVLALAACAGGALAGPGQAAGAGADPGCAPFTEFRPAEFPHPLRIDNRLYALAPGTRKVFEGRSNATGQVLPHRITLTVSDQTKVIDGVRTLVAWDVDASDGQVTEAELAFFAQDEDANVWTMGEYPEEYVDGSFAGAPNTWISGVAGAQAGVLVPGRPSVRHPEWLQGFSPDIGFLDCAVVKQTGGTACVPLGCFNHVTVIDERSPLDPTGGIQRKTYAPGVGSVAISAVKDPEGETLVLVESRTLDHHELWQARKEVRKLDRHGREVSEVYAKTPSVKRLWNLPAAS
jgi:hypothetical protein